MSSFPPISELPPLREVMRVAGLEPKKALGQNFLLDLNLTAKIARMAGDLSGFHVLEIGPGPGGLTRALLAAGAEKVIAVERDSRAVAALQSLVAAYPQRLEVIEADALRLDPLPFLKGKPTKIIANLPYNIGTELLIRWLRSPDWPPFYTSMTLMFQREVAERIVATPAERQDYGRLSILTQWRCEAEIMFDLPPSAFTPPPKVTSSVVHLVPRQHPLPIALEDLEAVTAAVFGQRRKMLRQSLKTLGNVEERLHHAGLLGTERPETLPLSAFIALASPPMLK